MHTEFTNCCVFEALHALDPIYREFSINQTMSDMARDLGFKDPRMLQSMIIFKVKEAFPFPMLLFSWEYSPMMHIPF